MKTTITDEQLEDDKAEPIIAEMVRISGTYAIPNGRLTWQHDILRDTETHETWFDSAAWTGINPTQVKDKRHRTAEIQDFRPDEPPKPTTEP